MQIEEESSSLHSEGIFSGQIAGAVCIYLIYLLWTTQTILRNIIKRWWFLLSSIQVPELKVNLWNCMMFFPSRFSCYVSVIFSGRKENRRGLYLSLWITQTKLQTFSERWCLTLVVLPRPPKSVCSREKEKLQSLFLSRFSCAAKAALSACDSKLCYKLFGK